MRGVGGNIATWAHSHASSLPSYRGHMVLSVTQQHCERALQLVRVHARQMQTLLPSCPHVSDKEQSIYLDSEVGHGVKH